MLIAAAAFVASPRASSFTEGRTFARVEHAVAVRGEEWTHAAPELQRRERIVRDDQGRPQLQRVIDYQ